MECRKGRSYRSAGGPQQTNMRVRRRYTSSVMFARERRPVESHMRRSLSHWCRQGQSQFQLQAISFFNKATSLNQQLDQLTKLVRQCDPPRSTCAGSKEKLVRLGSTVSGAFPTPVALQQMIDRAQKSRNIRATATSAPHRPSESPVPAERPAFRPPQVRTRTRVQ